MPAGWDADNSSDLSAWYRQATGSPIGNLSNYPQYDPKDESYYLNPDRDTTASIGVGDEDADAEISNRGPAPLTVIPTPSSDGTRPRTVAAGYQPYVGSKSQKNINNPDIYNRGKLTVMFRDGTLYNFYGVTRDEWVKFKGQLSIGPMLNRQSTNAPEGFLLSKPHGPADMSNVSERVASTIYRVARGAQVRYKSNRTRYIPMSSQPGTRVDRVVATRSAVPKNVKARMNRAVKSNQGGVNPAKHRGKNPY